MKNYLFFVILLTIPTLACNKESDNIITGTYNISSIAQSNCTNPTNNYVLNFDNDGCGVLGGIQICETGSFNFSADGSIASTIKVSAPALGEIFSINGTGTYVVNGSTATICLPDCLDLSRNDGNLTLNQVAGGCDQQVVFTKR